jgi:hypothetical protein
VADTKISALTAVSAVANTQEFVVNDSGTSKKANGQQIVDYLETIGFPRVKALGSTHSISLTAATEVSGLGPMTLEAGTYMFQYNLICRSSATGTGLGWGINFTGSVTKIVCTTRFVSNNTAGIIDDVANGTTATGQQVHGLAAKSVSTTAPNMVSAGVVTTASDMLVIVEGVLVAGGSGDLELWHSSETAAATTIETGSSVMVIRTA